MARSAEQKRSLIESRREQMFAVPDAADVERLRRFGELRRYPRGYHLAKSGEIAPRMFVIECVTFAAKGRSVYLIFPEFTGHVAAEVFGLSHLFRRTTRL